MPFTEPDGPRAGDANEAEFAAGRISAQIHRADRLTWAGTKIARWRFDGDGLVRMRQYWKGANSSGRRWERGRKARRTG